VPSKRSKNLPRNSASLQQVELIIIGQVQGVGYRFTIARLAKQLGITGFITNQPDGTVYILAQGSPPQLEELKQKCYAGPERAAVKQINERPSPLTDHYHSFTIKY